MLEDFFVFFALMGLLNSHECLGDLQKKTSAERFRHWEKKSRKQLFEVTEVVKTFKWVKLKPPIPIRSMGLVLFTYIDPIKIHQM